MVKRKLIENCNLRTVGDWRSSSSSHRQPSCITPHFVLLSGAIIDSIQMITWSSQHPKLRNWFHHFKNGYRNVWHRFVIFIIRMAIATNHRPTKITIKQSCFIRPEALLRAWFYELKMEFFCIFEAGNHG